MALEGPHSAPPETRLGNDIVSVFFFLCVLEVEGISVYFVGCEVMREERRVCVCGRSRSGERKERRKRVKREEGV